MTLSFGHIVFSQLRYLVTNLTKKNYKATVTEITQVRVRSVLGRRRMIAARFRTRARKSESDRFEAIVTPTVDGSVYRRHIFVTHRSLVLRRSLTRMDSRPINFSSVA